MLELIMDINDTISLAVGIIVAVVTVGIAAGAIIWNTSKRFQKQQDNYERGEEKHKEDMDNMNNEIQKLKDQRSALLLEYTNKIAELDKSITVRLNNDKLDRKEDIQKSLSNSKDEFASQLKQIEGLRRDLKDVDSTITKVNTKTDFIERQIEELKQCDDNNFKFVNKRIDTIESHREADLDYERRKQLLRDVPKEILKKDS